MIRVGSTLRACALTLVAAVFAAWIAGGAGSASAQDTQSPDQSTYEITLAATAHYLEQYGVRELFSVPAMLANGVRSEWLTHTITDPGLVARQLADSLGLRADATESDLAGGEVDVLISVRISTMRDSTEATVWVTRREQTVGISRWTEYETYYSLARTAGAWAVRSEVMTSIRQGGGRHVPMHAPLPVLNPFALQVPRLERPVDLVTM